MGDENVFIELKALSMEKKGGKSLKAMMNDYRELKASASVQRMIECVIDDALNNGTSPVRYDNMIESYYIVDLIDDLRGLGQETSEAEEELCRSHDFDYAKEYAMISYYPRTQMTASSVIVFPFVEISERVASFISNISRSYAVKEDDNHVASSPRGGAPGETNFRVSLIACNSSDQVVPLVQAIDFDDEIDYWGFIAALSRAIMRKEEGIFGGWQGNCNINMDQESDKNVISSIFGGQQRKIKVFVTHDDLIVADNGKQLFEMPLNRLKALTLSSDWPAPKEYVMNVELGEGPQGEGVRMHLLDTNLEPVAKSSYYHMEMRPQTTKRPGIGGSTSVTYAAIQKVLLPMNFDEIINGKCNSGLTSVAVVDASTAPGESTVSAIDTIPFANMMYYQQPTSNTDPQETPKEPLPRPILHQIVQQHVRTAATQSASKALEVHLLSAEGLKSGHGHNRQPHVYCACYLIDTQGNRMGATLGDRVGMFKGSDGEWKTDPVESRDPHWDTKIQMQEDQDVGVSSNVSHVLIIFKDVFSKFRRPVHIGEVTVPIGCFIERQPVPLTLPLEATPKMPESLEVSGMVHIMAQAIAIGKVSRESFMGNDSRKSTKSEEGEPKVKSMYRVRALSTSRKNEAVPIKYALKPAATDALNVFWPFRVLGGGIAATEGHICCKRDCFVVDLSPGSGGLLANCAENHKALKNAVVKDRLLNSRRKKSNSITTTGQHKTIFTLEWESVESVLAVSESVLMLSVRVTKESEQAGVYSTQQVSQEILVAPCPARMLQLGITERKNATPIRKEMRAFRATVADSRTQAGGIGNILDAGRDFIGELAGMLDVEARMCHAVLSSYDLREPTITVLEAQNNGREFGTAGRDSRWGGSGKRPVLTRKLTSMATNKATLMTCISPGTAGGYEICLVSARLRARAALYRVQLAELCKGLSSIAPSPRAGPKVDFSVEGTREKVAKDLEGVDLMVKRDADGLTEELYLRFGLICDYVTDTLRIYTLCSMDADEDTVRKCAAAIVHDCYSALREGFDEYLGSPDAFKRTPGQEAKIMLLQLVVTQNDYFEELVRDHLHYLGYRITSPLSLLPQNYTSASIIDWYCSSLVQEMQSLLAKALDQASNFKTNQSGLPWDYEENGGQIVSSLPETVLVQLSTYLDVVTSTGRRFVKTFDKEWKKYGRKLREAKEEARREAEVISADDVYHDFDHSSGRCRSGERSAAHDFTRQIYIAVVEAVNKCLLLLSEEYSRALKTKHWSRAIVGASSKDAVATGYGGENEEANFLFLVSVVNDCNRICNSQLDGGEYSADPEIVQLSSRRKVVQAFYGISNQVILHLVRIIFADAHDVIVGFPTMWANQSNFVVGRLLECMQSYFKPLRTQVGHAYMKEIVEGCADVLCACFVYMLKERSRSGPKLIAQELLRLQSDLKEVEVFFDKALGRELCPSRASLDKHDYVPIKQMRVAQNVLEVLVAPYPAEAESLMSLFKTTAYAHDLPVASAMLEAAISLRPVDSESTKAEVVENLLEMANEVLLQAYASPGAFDSSGESRLDRILRGLFVDPDTSSVNVPGKGNKRGPMKSNSAFKRLRETVSDTIKDGLKSQKRVQSKVLRLQVLRAFDLTSDDTLEAMRSRTDSSISVSTTETGPRESMKGTCILTMSRIEVKNIRTMSVFSSANPYVYMKVGKVRKVKTEVYWGASAGYAMWPKASLELEVPRSKIENGTVEICVYDKEPIRRKRLIGKVEVKLAGLELHRIQSWFALTGGEYTGAELFAVLDIATDHSSSPKT